MAFRQCTKGKKARVNDQTPTETKELALVKESMQSLRTEARSRFTVSLPILVSTPGGIILLGFHALCFWLRYANGEP